MLDLLYILNKNDFKLAVVSSNKEDNILEFFKVNNVNLDIEVFVSRGLFDKSKVIKRFIKRNRFTRTDVLYVGDEIRDIKACEKSSVDIAFVKWGLDGNENIDMYKPKFVVCSQDELKKIICE
jgi:phosphoglycolate phosphatase